MALAVFGVIALALLAGGYGYYQVAAGKIREENHQTLAAIGELKSRQIQRWRKERQQDAARLIRSSLTRKAVADFLRHPDDAQSRADLRENLRVEREVGENQDVLLFAADGTLLLAANDAPHPAHPVRQRAIAAAIASQQPVISDFYQGHQGDVLIDICAAIRDAGGQALAVVVLCHMPQNYLFPLIQSWPTSSGSAETLLVEREGDSVVYLNDLRYQSMTALTLREPLTHTWIPAVQAVLGKQGIFEGRDYRGVEVLADLHPIAGSPWFMVAKVDAEEIVAEARYRAFAVSLIIGAFILLAAVVLGSIYRQWQNRIFRYLYESERQELEARKNYRLLFEGMLDGFAEHEIICDAAGRPADYRFLAVNPAFERITGLRANDVVGRTVLELMPATEALWIERYGHVALTGEGMHFEEYSIALQRHFEVAAFRPKPGRFATIFIDITERKQAEADLQSTLADLKRSNQELEQFAYVASHDLQEPLRMVSSYTQLLAQRYQGQLDDKANKFIHYAVDGAIRMQALINDLLAYSRAGSRSLLLEPADTRAVFDLAKRNLTAMIAENQAIITDDALPTVLADASQLVLVFQNLLANAIKFRGKDPPRIHVSARQRQHDWVFAVKDHGIGIEARHAERIFVLFQRLHTREEYPGTGIGLAICQRIVERHGGTIGFESDPGNGSTFFFTLPQSTATLNLQYPPSPHENH